MKKSKGDKQPNIVAKQLVDKEVVLPSPSVTLIFGAGASHGSGGCSKTPPLGKDLFNDLNEGGGAFLPLLNKSGGAFSQLKDDIKSVFLNDGFEAGMAMIANDNREIIPLQRELALFFSSFQAKNDNAYVRLFSRLRAYTKQLNIVTLNYDLLIEQALISHQLDFNYHGNGNGINLLKLHGSSNFLPRFPTWLNINNLVAKKTSVFFEGLETDFVFTHEEVTSWHYDNNNIKLSPIIAMYEKGKRVVINNELINEIQLNYSRIMKMSSSVILVGIRYTADDVHVWKPIQESNADLFIVNTNPSDTLAWAKKYNFRNISVLENSFDKVVWDIIKIVRSYYL
ncbi:MAG: hypothetical protein WA635_01155 [Gallionella sp.]